VVEKIEVSFENESDGKLFKKSLEEFRLNKRIGRISDKPALSLNGGEGGKPIFIYEICKFEDDLVENIEVLIKRFNGKRFYSNLF